MNGTSTWKPAGSVPRYFPRRSMTYAFCCGTTTAVFAMTKMTSTARITTTMRAWVTGTLPFSSRAEEQGEALHTCHAAALALGQPLGVDVFRVPRGTAKLGLPVSTGRDVFHGN